MKALSIAAAATLALGAAAHAAPVNGTGNVTPNVIMGTGIGNGSWTGQTANNIEVAMRGKQRYPAAAIYNYDGDHTYQFAMTPSTPSNRSTFNFEWAINVHATGNQLADYDYILSIDTDPSAAIVFSSFDPMAGPGYDHSLGHIGTAQSGGIESPDLPTMLTNLGLYEVAQQSWNLGFGFSAGPPGANGIYDFQLSVTAKGDPSTVLATTAITIVATPLPAALPMLAAALGLAGLVSRRRKV
jgi:hypothetical protein